MKNKQYTIMVFDDNKVDLQELRNMVKEGKAVFIGEFPESGFEKLNDFHTEVMEDDLNNE